MLYTLQNPCKIKHTFHWEFHVYLILCVCFFFHFKSSKCIRFTRLMSCTGLKVMFRNTNLVSISLKLTYTLADLAQLDCEANTIMLEDLITITWKRSTSKKTECPWLTEAQTHLMQLCMSPSYCEQVCAIIWGKIWTSFHEWSSASLFYE